MDLTVTLNRIMTECKSLEAFAKGADSYQRQVDIAAKAKENLIKEIVELKSQKEKHEKDILNLKNDLAVIEKSHAEKLIAKEKEIEEKNIDLNKRIAEIKNQQEKLSAEFNGAHMIKDEAMNTIKIYKEKLEKIRAAAN